MLQNSCYNCHSNRTQWPWYSRAWPLSSFIGGDVERARASMNFSDWPGSEEHAGLSAGLLAASCAAMQSGDMPPARYLWLHPEARPSKEATAQFCAWSVKEVARLVAERRRLRQSRGPHGIAPATPGQVRSRGSLALINLPR